VSTTSAGRTAAFLIPRESAMPTRGQPPST
jgi:hypothetical protein